LGRYFFLWLPFEADDGSFNNVGRVSELSNLWRTLKKGSQLVPVIAPRTKDQWVLRSPGFLESVELDKRHLFRCGLRIWWMMHFWISVFG
jgi:hypothetical protein